ncbi:SH3 domain-containing protein [Streptomyces sp. NPDC049936]|uniref:SH3 domain-containing protein n=1 Tax=Streptomyces sp. NPDC049936 TaxID=3365599 RepID=UPI00379FA5D2
MLVIGAVTPPTRRASWPGSAALRAAEPADLNLVECWAWREVVLPTVQWSAGSAVVCGAVIITGNGVAEMRQLSRQTSALGVTVGVLLAVTGMSSAAVATTMGTGEGPAQVRNACFEQQTCFVTENNVNFRSGPGTNYPSLGQVHRGQGFDVVEYSDHWFRGTLWGGPSDVWIHSDYLDM